LKHKISEKEALPKNSFTIYFGGMVLDDYNPIGMYGIINGATVHVFKQMNIEKKLPTTLIDNTNNGIVQLGSAFRSLSLNSSYKCALMKISKTQMINDLIMSTAGLNEDPVAVTFLQRPELLVKISDVGSIRHLLENHPALASAAIQISSAVSGKVVQVTYWKSLMPTIIYINMDIFSLYVRTIWHQMFWPDLSLLAVMKKWKI